MLRMSTSVNAPRASWFLGSERRRSSHFEKRDVSSVLLGLVQGSFNVRFAREAVRSSIEENFSTSRVIEGGAGLDGAEPITRGYIG